MDKLYPFTFSFGTFKNPQIPAVQILGDCPKSRVNFIALHHDGVDEFPAKTLCSLKPVTAGNQDEFFADASDGNRAPESNHGHRLGKQADALSIARATIAFDGYVCNSNTLDTTAVGVGTVLNNAVLTDAAFASIIATVVIATAVMAVRIYYLRPRKIDADAGLGVGVIGGEKVRNVLHFITDLTE